MGYDEVVLYQIGFVEDFHVLVCRHRLSLIIRRIITISHIIYSASSSCFVERAIHITHLDQLQIKWGIILLQRIIGKVGGAVFILLLVCGATGSGLVVRGLF